MKKHGSQHEVAKKPISTLWLLTYADLMSLLMAFFVMLFAFSEVDNQKFKQIDLSMKEAFGTAVPVSPQTEDDHSPYLLPFMAQQKNDMRMVTDPTLLKVEQQAASLKEMLAQQGTQDKVAVEQYGRIIIIRLQENGAFMTGSAELSDDIKPTLKVVGETLKKIDGDIIVSGYTDNVPIKNSTYRSNWELSAARAYSVIVELTDQGGVDPERVIMRGFGEHHALFPNDSDENRAKNRRVDIMIDQGITEREMKMRREKKEDIIILTPQGLNHDKNMGNSLPR